MSKTKTDTIWIYKKRDNKEVESSKKLFPLDVAHEAREFHMQIPGNKISPLKNLNNLARMFGVGGIWIKDESERLELNSFKVLGGSFALYKFIQKKLGLEGQTLTYDFLVSNEVKEKLGKLTFSSATDGNHGRGIAWAAGKLGHKCVIYVHSETSESRIQAIRDYGATVKIIDGNYDDAVKQIVIDSEKNGWNIISDTSWDGYTTVPSWIMQGYTTIYLEIQEQFSAQGIIKPTHIFIQAGVGALAASIIGFYHSLFGKDAPISVVVEPENAACLYESIKMNDGQPHTVTGSLNTIMAGLACGEPSPIAWSILKDTADAFVVCPDYVAAKGMRIYATPLKGDSFIVSGESGAVTLGALVGILSQEGLQELKTLLKLDNKSQILLINTEGNTDPVQFKQIIWEGSNPVPKEFWTSDRK
ncbi:MULTISPECIES: diaminopropionate ammonia-lyase [unclassified Oceanispirochaeta]|uniref:diaminopropionate ammonia-lyase n=1 Tax=unclassified Oceanispirochaeta TaxID=2635722 RepID=UPI000E08F86D|nr:MULTISPECIES: diaminopropionate ammonia-lyase [unclassified Oceanispirochaeta]MBF9018778.1 diaminopropionate ammonia-lyase [Oceanispirochaeta sp. M2]NPD75247.1 diaminopropionate ammonia-lyase [Oceanispirochaeta sp. M1]RDG28909.1 diaminopropionate ammonia-lyase [Oceanispirochaeta sp. M1]